METSNETLRQQTPKYPNEKSVYEKCVYYRCQHNTRHQPTMNSKDRLKKNPSQRLKNTDCPFSLALKFKRAAENEFNCMLELEWTHNHPINSLQSLSFRDIGKDVSAEIYQLFDNGFTPGLAYREFLRKTKQSASSELDLHKIMSDCSIFPRRTDYNYLYTEYHRTKYGTQNISTMFEKLNSKYIYIYISSVTGIQFSYVKTYNIEMQRFFTKIIFFVG